MDKNFIFDMDRMKEAIDIAKPHGLDIEVIVTAIHYLKEHPGFELEEALIVAIKEWDL